MSELNRADLLHGYGAIGDFLGITKRQAEHWAASTDLPTFKVGRTVCARRSTLKQWLARREREPVDPHTAIDEDDANG